MENWAETRGDLDQMLALERALARQRRQQQRQQLLHKGKRLQGSLRQAVQWLGIALLHVLKTMI